MYTRPWRTGHVKLSPLPMVSCLILPAQQPPCHDCVERVLLGALVLCRASHTGKQVSNGRPKSEL